MGRVIRKPKGTLRILIQPGDALPPPTRGRAGEVVNAESRGFLVDNSILQKLSRSASIRRRFAEITTTYPIYTCQPQALEYCFSARNSAEYQELRADMELYTPAVKQPSQELVLDIQQALWESNRMRAAGVVDVLIAAYAIMNQLTVLNSDRDFAHIQGAYGSHRFKQEFVPEDDVTPTRYS